MKKTGYIFFFLVCFMLACQKPPQEETSPRTQQTFITQEDINSRLRFLDEKDRAFAKTQAGKENLLQIIAREKLILADARNSGLAQQKDFLQAAEQKRAHLNKIYNEFEDDLLSRLWYEQQQKKGTLSVSEQEIKTYFNKYPYEMTIKQIITDNAQTADQILRRLKGYPADWKSMSAQYNIAPESLQNITFMPGEYLPNLEVIAANSPTGKVEGFFKTPQGFHIIMKTGERRLTLKEAEPRIRQVLEQQKLDDLLGALKTKYEVIIYDQN